MSQISWELPSSLPSLVASFLMPFSPLISPSSLVLPFNCSKDAIAEASSMRSTSEPRRRVPRSDVVYWAISGGVGRRWHKGVAAVPRGGAGKGRKMRSTFFNYFVFCLSCGGLIAVTLVVWVEDNKGWEWGFGIAMLSIFLSMVVFFAGSPLYRNKIPIGSPLTTISKVLVAAMFGCCVRPSSRNSIASMAMSPAPDGKEAKQNEEGRDSTDVVDEPSKSLKFLNNAVLNKPFHSALECTVKEVEEVKIVLKILPIFACTIILNCCVAQLSTFSVEQASTMDTKIGSFKVPPASLPVFPILFIMFLAPIYDHVIIPFARRIRKTEMGISQLQRIGVGLIFSIGAMTVAAVVETKRKRVATENGLLDSAQPLPITFLWIAIQFLFLGSADLLSLAGSLEFFFTEAPASMRSLATSLSWASMAMGFYLSSVVVSIVNNVTGNSNHHPWLSGKNINHYHLERFYWLMCVLSVMVLHFLTVRRHDLDTTTTSLKGN